MESMTPAQIKDIVEQVRQGNQVNMINEVNKAEETFRENENVMAEETRAWYRNKRTERRNLKKTASDQIPSYWGQKDCLK